MSYVLESCDHEWQQRRLWNEGVRTRPSEVFRRQIYVDFWYEKAGIELRELVGVDNIMWESDYPHIASTYPRSWSFVEASLGGVPEEERKKMCYGNALRLYGVALVSEPSENHLKRSERAFIKVDFPTSPGNRRAMVTI